jgi:hypothetical protein
MPRLMEAAFGGGEIVLGRHVFANLGDGFEAAFDGGEDRKSVVGTLH